MPNQTIDISPLYLWVYIKMRSNANVDGVITTNKVLEIINYYWRQNPSDIKYCALLHMEQQGLLVKLDKKRFKILKSNKDKKLKRYKDLLF